MLQAIWSPVAYAGGQGDGSADPLRIPDRPFQRPHPAHRTAEDHGESIDTQVVGQRHFRGNLVADGDPREPRAVPPAVRRWRRRTGGAAAPTQHIGRDHEEPVGVQRRTGGDQPVPPSRGRLICSGGPDHVRVTGERVQDENRVVPHGVQRSPGFVGDGDGVQPNTRFGGERADVGVLARGGSGVGRLLGQSDAVADGGGGYGSMGRGRHGRCDASFMPDPSCAGVWMCAGGSQRGADASSKKGSTAWGWDRLGCGTS